MPTCVNYRNGVYRLYSSITDSYTTGPLSEEEVLEYPEVTLERVKRARLNGCSYIPSQIRCRPGEKLVRVGSDLVPEDPTEWETGEA